MAKDEYVARLRAVPLFAALPKKELEGLLRRADHLRYDKGHTVIKEGTTGEEFWLVIEGKLTVERGGDVVAKLGPGDYFGELSVLDPAPRNATVTATAPVELMVIGRREFWSTLEGSPSLMRKVIIGLAKRLHEADARDTATRRSAKKR